MVKKKSKFMAIQNGCNNIIYADEYDENDNCIRVFDTEKNAKDAAEYAIRHEENGYDSCEGDVVIYELTSVHVGKTPSSVIWKKA